eukprot:m.29393 g.29393  ORF g.29393 m.29393 type:complete len:350 (+) comp6681_c0_seq2:85-1134(+)
MSQTRPNSVAQPHNAMAQSTVNYVGDHIEPSLYRNGKLGVRRDQSGSDVPLAESTDPSAAHAPAPVVLRNGRTAEPKMNLRLNGFEMRPRPSLPIDYYSFSDTVNKYYRDCENAVKEATGARWVFAFDHNLRSKSGNSKLKRQADAAEGRQGLVQGPARVVHGDYTLRSAPDRLRQLGEPPKANDTLKDILGDKPLLPPEVLAAATAPEGRWGLINVWRNIADTPVQAYPLACTNAKTFKKNELVTFEIHYNDRIGENYFAKYNPNHEWYLYPHLTRDEILLLKQWDSAGTLAKSGGRVADADGSVDSPSTFSFHSAIDQPPPPGAPDRESMEVRCVVIYDPPQPSSKL